MNPSALPLRDIHLPPPPGWWPPAPGWWLLLFIAVVVALVLWQLRRRRTPRSAAVAARQELARLRAAAPQLDPRQVAEELSVLMRRIAISFHPRAAAAALTGEAWLRFLDQDLPGSPFSSGPGRLLAELPYRPAVAVADTQPLLELCAQWIDAAAKRGEARK